MVILVQSDGGSPSSAPAIMRCSLASDSSSSCSSDDHVEEGARSSTQGPIGMEIVSKYLPTREGKRPRRKSQCEQLSYRGSESSIDELDAYSPTMRPWTPPVVKPHPAKPSSSPKRSSPLLVAMGIALLALVAVVVMQQLRLSALREELTITHQHRAYMDRTNSNLQAQLNMREASLGEYKRTQERLNRLNQDLSETLAQAKATRENDRLELERLRAVERRARLAEGFSADER